MWSITTPRPSRWLAIPSVLRAMAGLQDCDFERGRAILMKGRSGATLIEVLVAIFVTSLGLIALMALFPVGALSMARAIQNSRAAQAASNASGIALIPLGPTATPLRTDS